MKSTLCEHSIAINKNLPYRKDKNMRNIIDINSEWILSTEKKEDGTSVHKRILPLYKEDNYAYYLEFLSAAPVMEISLNGEKIAVHNGSFTLFRVDVTDRIVNGDNELDVCCTGDCPAVVANLILVESTHFSLDHYGDAGMLVQPSEVTASSASVKLRAYTNCVPADAMISYTILTTTGTMLANKSVPASSPEYVCHLSNPSLWHGKVSPSLYVAVAAFISGGRIVDQIVLPFGLRTVTTDARDHLAVNGSPVPEKEVLRTTETDPYFYDDMDTAGTFLCADLTPLCNGCTDTADCELQIREFVLQHSYHPSILCWKLPADAADFANVIREVDPYRPVLL